MSDAPFDIAILGGGPGGYVAALHAAAKGARVALVERDRVGGTCVTVGCIPSKALLDSSHLFHALTHGLAYGINAPAASFDLAAAVARKDAIVARLVGGIEGLLKARRVELVRGAGTLVGPGEIRVEAAEPRSIRANATIVATGSKIGVPNIAGLAEARPLDNVGALALTRIPPRLLVIGGGVVGLELGTFFAELGSAVTILEMLPQPIAFAEPDLVRTLLRSLQVAGVALRAGARVIEVRRRGSNLTASAEIAGHLETFEADEVLLGAGRVPNLSGVEHAGFVTNSLGITVDDHLRTSVGGVWAIGDCAGDPRAPKLAHVASAQGEVAVDTILGEDRRVDYDAVPNVVYTHPELAQVGLTEAQAKERYGAVTIGRFPFAASGRALALGESDGFVKIVTTGGDHRLVGVHIVGAQASELIAEATLAIRLEATAEDLIATMHAHPTLSEALREAALMTEGRAIHVPGSRQPAG